MHNLRAALLMVLAMAAFACEDALLKGLSGRIPTGQLLAVIGFAGMAVFGLWIAFSPEGLRLRNLLRPQVALRNLCEGVCAITFVTALATGDLSIASAILQAQPLLMTLGAALFLGEQVGWRRWMSIAVGFAGVLILLAPSLQVSGLGVLFALLGTAAFAAMVILGRSLRETPDRDLVLFQLAAATLAGLVLAPFDWQPVRSLSDLGLLFLLGVVATAAHMLVTRSLKLADASVVAPLQYSLLVWGALLGFVVFGDVPATGMIAGAALIVGSGLIVLRRSSRDDKSATTEATAPSPGKGLAVEDPAA